MIQGFSTGGEYGGAATFMAEYAPDDRRGFFGSFLEFGTLAGFSLGASLMLVFSLALGDAAMHDWGWRIPFLTAAPMGLLGTSLRSRLDDTPPFLEECVVEAARNHPGLGPLVPYPPQPLFLFDGPVWALHRVHYRLH